MNRLYSKVLDVVHVLWVNAKLSCYFLKNLLGLVGQQLKHLIYQLIVNKGNWRESL